MNLGASERVGDKIRKVQLEGSRYADRSPIGSPEVIEKAQREQLLRYYRDWYRPDLMAVIVVGDVQREAVRSLIVRHFSALTNPTSERPRPNYDVPEQPATRYAVVTDKETTATTVQISNLRPARNQGTVGGYRSILADQLFGAMLSARLSELTQSANPPFLDAAAERDLFPAPKTRDQAIAQALVANEGVTRGLEALAAEVQRVVRFGFNASELDRAKQANMALSERVVAESPDRESASRADEYTRNFLQSEALPTIWQELAFHRHFFPGITLAEINGLAGDWFPDRNRLVVVIAPDAAGVVMPSETQLAAALKAGSEKTLEAYVDDGAGQTLMDAAPARGSITRTTVRPEGITEWTLSNGATVVLKPTTLRADQILFRAFAPGGASLASDADFPSARAADDVVGASGAGKFSGVALDKVLSGKAVVVRPFISEIDQGMRGGSTPQDLETMFQLLYLRVTAPRLDMDRWAAFKQQVAPYFANRGTDPDEVYGDTISVVRSQGHFRDRPLTATTFAAVSSQARALVANQTASPDVMFSRAVDSALNGGNPRRLAETPETVRQWNLDKALAFYKARFADASNFTFVFVGSFTVDRMKPLVETYLASLPATRARETWRDLGPSTPRGVIKQTVEKGIAPKSEVTIVFSGPFQYDDANTLALETMVLLLQSRLSDAIREELGGTYSITATPEVSKIPRPEYHVRIDWTCDPARTDSLVQRVMQEVAGVRDTLLSAGQMARVRDLLMREFDRNSQDNGYLLGQIARRYEEGDAANVGMVFQMPQRIAALNGYAIQLAAGKYLDPANYVQITLTPETVTK
jgi:zinc protease